jgi:hypothetical protein
MNREPEACRRTYLEDGFVVVPDLARAPRLRRLEAAQRRVPVPAAVGADLSRGVVSHGRADWKSRDGRRELRLLD